MNRKTRLLTSISHPRHREGTLEDLEGIERSGGISDVLRSPKLPNDVSMFQENGAGWRT